MIVLHRYNNNKLIKRWSGCLFILLVLCIYWLKLAIFKNKQVSHKLHCTTQTKSEQTIGKFLSLSYRYKPRFLIYSPSLLIVITFFNILTKSINRHNLTIPINRHNLTKSINSHNFFCAFLFNYSKRSFTNKPTKPTNYQTSSYIYT